MRDFFGALRIDIRRSFLSPLFVVTVILIVLLNCLSVYEEYISNPAPSVVYLFEMFVMGGPLNLICMFFGLVPYGQSFCVDWKNQFIRSNVIRTTRDVYAWSKVTTVALSAFGAILIGYFGTILLFMTQMPLLGADYDLYGFEVYNSFVFGQLMTIHPLLFLLVRISVLGFSCVFWALFALLISSYSTNIFVVFASPVIAYYFVINAGSSLPINFRINSLVSGAVNLGGPLWSYLYILLFFATGSTIFGALFCRQVKRRLANG